MPARLFNHRLPPQQIRTFLILFALALTLPLVGLAAFALNQTTRLEEREIRQRVLQVAQSLAAGVDRELENATVTLQTLATSLALAQGDFSAFHHQASRALRRERAGILLVDRSFQQLVNTRVAFGTPLPMAADRRTSQKVFDTKQRQISDLFIGQVSKQPVINVEVPILYDDEVRYVLIMTMDATRFEQILRSQRLEAQWITGITDNNGTILARSERHAEFVGKPLPPDLLQQSRTAQGVFRAKNVTGDEILRATVRSENAGWLVSATVLLAHLEAPRRRGQLFALAMLTTAIGLGALLAYIFATFMARPLRSATAAAAALGRGEQVHAVRSPLAEANAVVGALSSASAELSRKQKESDFLMRELAHRSKNLLAVIQGMALQTARQTDDVNQFVSQFLERLQGLGESVDLMVKQNWQGAWLADLVVAHLDLFGGGTRSRAEGPALFLSPVAVQNIGFALNELATNASKHGSLSGLHGHILVSWRVLDDGRIRIEWTERDGSIVRAPARQGFGFLVLTELVPQALQGTARLAFEERGFSWWLEIPSFHCLRKDQEKP